MTSQNYAENIRSRSERDFKYFSENKELRGIVSFELEKSLEISTFRHKQAVDAAARESSSEESVVSAEKSSAGAKKLVVDAQKSFDEEEANSTNARKIVVKCKELDVNLVVDAKKSLVDAETVFSETLRHRGVAFDILYNAEESFDRAEAICKKARRDNARCKDAAFEAHRYLSESLEDLEYTFDWINNNIRLKSSYTDYLCPYCKASCCLRHKSADRGAVPKYITDKFAEFDKEINLGT